MGRQQPTETQPSEPTVGPGDTTVDRGELTRPAGGLNHQQTLMGSMGTLALQQIEHSRADQPVLQQLLIGLRHHRNTLQNGKGG